MAKKLKRQRKTLAQRHRELFPPIEPVPDYYPQQPPSPPSGQGYMVVTVASYGGYQPPIEGWSLLNAELGRGTK
jgi:hypothetical protein